MKLRELIQKLANTESPLARDPNVPDDQTTDKVLRSLRRQRRVQLEEFEKKRLMVDIAEHNRRRDAQTIMGDGKNVLTGDGKKLSYREPRHYKKTRLI